MRAAFELSWRELAPISQLVGQFLSSFKKTVIPWELVTFSSDIQLLNWANTDIKLAKQQLYSLYLIQRLEEREACYEIHPLIREFFQYKLNASEQADALQATFLVVIKTYYQKLAYEMLEQYLDWIEEEVAEQFENLEFSERWHHSREMDRAFDLGDITVTVDCVKIIKKSILDIDNIDIDDKHNQFKYEIGLEIGFTAEGSYPSVEWCYRDPDDGELVFLNTITEVGEQQIEIVTAKVKIVFDANDPLDTNEVEVEGVELVDAPTEIEIKPVDIKMSLDFEDFE